MKLAPDFWQSKTLKLTVLTVATAALSAALGLIPPLEAGQTILGALYALFIRDAVAKAGTAQLLAHVIKGR